jgi:hypothetical protein
MLRGYAFLARRGIKPNYRFPVTAMPSIIDFPADPHEEGCVESPSLTVKNYYTYWPLTNYGHMLIINFDRRRFEWQGQEIAGEWIPSLKAITLNLEVSLFPCWKKSF